MALTQLQVGALRYVWTDSRTVRTSVKWPTPKVKITDVKYPSEAIVNRDYSLQISWHVEQGPPKVRVAVGVRNLPQSPGDMIVAGKRIPPGGEAGWEVGEQGPCGGGTWSTKIRFLKTGTYTYVLYAGYVASLGETEVFIPETEVTITTGVPEVIAKYRDYLTLAGVVGGGLALGYLIGKLVRGKRRR